MLRVVELLGLQDVAALVDDRDLPLPEPSSEHAALTGNLPLPLELLQDLLSSTTARYSKFASEWTASVSCLVDS